MPIMLYPKTEADWLAMRAEDVTSTESPALLGMSPYATAFELFHRKTGQLSIEIEETARMRWGKRLEPVIARGVAEDHGVRVRRLSAYCRHSHIARMGASFDYEIVGLDPCWIGEDTELRRLYREKGAGVLEVKNVDGLIFRNEWLKDGRDIEAPYHIELQLQHQLEVIGRQWGVIAPLVGGNSPHLVIRERDDEVGQALAAKVVEFWAAVDANRPPPPDYERDGKTLAELGRYATPGREVDLRHSNRLADLCAEYKAAAGEESEARKRKDAAKAEILDLIGDAEKAIAAGWNISAKTTPETEIPATVRKAFRNIRITAQKGAA